MFKRFKDSITGVFVTKAEAKRRPGTTHAETAQLIAPAELLKLRVTLAKAEILYREGEYKSAFHMLSGEVNDLIARAKGG